MTLCRHCEKVRSNRPRGLCWTCYYTPGVRESYPSVSKFARRGSGNANYGQRLPEPTDALPGTEAKIVILEERVARGEMLFHPDDAQGDGLREERQLAPLKGNCGPRRNFCNAAA